MSNYKSPKTSPKNDIRIDGIALTRTPAQMAQALMEQAMCILDINFDEVVQSAPEMSVAEIIRISNMMRDAAELMEAAAVLKTVTGMPTRCPNCGEDLTRYIENNEVW